MDEAELPHAIELLVGLLGLAAFVAIVARPLRLPYTVALVIAGLAVGIAAGAAGIPSLPVSSDIVLLVLLPGLVFEAGYRLRFPELRRWFRGLALLAIGMFISTLTENQIIAAILSFGVVLLLWLVDAFARNAGSGSLLSRLSILQPLNDFVSGVISTAHIVFYLSLMLVGLFLTYRSLDSLRWRG